MKWLEVASGDLGNYRRNRGKASKLGRHLGRDYEPIPVVKDDRAQVVDAPGRKDGRNYAVD